MFKKKYEQPKPNGYDIQFKELWKSLSGIARMMENLAKDIETHKKVAEWLPDLADKQFELEKVEDAKKKMQNLLAAYDEDFRAITKIDRTKLEVCSQYGYPDNSHIALQHIARRMYNLWHRG